MGLRGKDNMEKRKIFVLLTQFPGFNSKALRVWTQCPYTHVSIGLDEDMNTFYSFVLKGFIVEKITRYEKRFSLPCQVYELNVSDKAYDRLKKIISIFEENKYQMEYSRLGVVMGLLRIGYKRKYKYFCSQFVAEVLKLSESANLKKKSSLYLPHHLKKIPGLDLKFQGNLTTFLSHFGIERSAAA